MVNNFGIKQMFLIAVLIGALMFLVWITSLLFPVATTTYGAFGNALSQTTEGVRPLIDVKGDNINGTDVLLTAINNSEETINQLSIFPYVLLIASIIFFFIIAINVKAHPSLILLWMGLIFIIVMISIPLSNSYTYAVNSNPSVYGSQDSLTNLYNQQLPIIFTIFGLLGGVFLFILIQKEPEWVEGNI